MNKTFDAWGILRKLSWQDMLLVLVIIILARLIALVVRAGAQALAENSHPRLRLSILRIIPIARILIGIGAIVAIVPVLVEPTFQDVVALLASAVLALAFALKDLFSSLAAGLTTVLENTYQPGDWIEVDGIYGEVKSIGVRSVRIVTADDDEVIIPHSRLWSTSFSNSTSGNRSLLCVADFYLHPDHDAAAARNCLEEVAKNTPRRKPESLVAVIVLEKPWGTHYRVKAYAKESREQFLFITDITVSGKEALRALGFRFAQSPFAETKC